ncbi:hypothetical protein EJ06DRAFT_83947 [Trichodelitschia bisporula]|uniref:Uncharacterized protein n=1 Tax=Trichodelitschia bisporula TaxID=703511 RepID=A0A6G1HS47_9PEZI|nr:hypothetical protein EJ06DRAFT_83947 [Trichodelitschia bisporula]
MGEWGSQGRGCGRYRQERWLQTQCSLCDPGNHQGNGLEITMPQAWADGYVIDCRKVGRRKEGEMERVAGTNGQEEAFLLSCVVTAVVGYGGGVAPPLSGFSNRLVPSLMGR